MQTRLHSFLIATLFAFVSSTVFAASINWQPYSNSAFNKAKQEHKQILIFGKAEWCPWCRKMKDTTYSDNAVVAFINSHFIPVRVDIDNDASAANAYNIEVVPKTVIVDANGRTVDSQTGYINSGEMLKFLQSNAR